MFLHFFSFLFPLHLSGQFCLIMATVASFVQSYEVLK